MGKRVVLLGLFNGQKMGGGVNEFVATEDGLLEDGEAMKGMLQMGVKGDGEKFVEPSSVPQSGVEEAKPQSIVSTKSLKDGEVKVLTRVTAEDEYVKCVVSGGRVVGAMLVGDCADLADTMEQIMLSRINIDALGFDLLDDNIDIDEFFD